MPKLNRYCPWLAEVATAIADGWHNGTIQDTIGASHLNSFCVGLDKSFHVPPFYRM